MEQPFPAKITVEFKTNMHYMGTNDLQFVLNFLSGHDEMGSLRMRYLHPSSSSNNIEYEIRYCSDSKDTVIPVEVLPATVYVWRLTFDRTSGIRLAINVNNVKVLDELLSDSVCTNTKWSEYWTKDVTMMTIDYKSESSGYPIAENNFYKVLTTGY